MCAGTYKEVIFPVIEEWSRAVSESVGVRLNSSPQMDIKLNSVRHNEESSYKCIQSVAKLEYSSKKIKVHIYHTNQTCWIQGQSHEDFYEKFLIPMIGELI